MENSYLLLKMLHIFGVIVFVGNIIVTAFWKVMADRSRDPRIAAFAQRLVNWTDFAFTSLGAFIILVTGLMMGADITQHLLEVKWIAWGIGLFLGSGLVWATILFPLQVKQAWMAREFEHDHHIPERYWRLGKLWVRVAMVATALALANLYFMVVKPL
jgi:uncharacterized membrane protein